MVARVKPEVVGVVTGRVTHKAPNYDIDLSYRRQRGNVLDGFGSPIRIDSFGGCEMSYREKITPIGNKKLITRKYYIGYIQFAFVRFDPDGVIVHLTGQDDPAQGVRLLNVCELVPYLRKQLILA